MEGILLFNEYDNHIFSVLSIKKYNNNITQKHIIFYAVTSI